MIWSLNYSGDNIFYVWSGDPIDRNHAQLWYKNVELEEVTLRIFGKEEKQILPVVDEWEAVYTLVFKALSELLLEWKIEHYQVRKIQEVFKQYAPVIHKGFLCVKKVERAWWRNTRKDLLLVKEMMDGYYNYWFFSRKLDNMPHQIWYTYDVVIDGIKWEVTWAYAPKTRQNLFEWSEFELETGKLMQDWQTDLHIMMGQITYVLVRRRSGKSYIAVELALREIQKHKHKGKVIEVVYLSSDESKLDTIMNYVDDFCAASWGLFNIGRADKFVEFYTYEEDNGLKQRVLNGRITFLTAWGKNPWVGGNYQLIIIDEAWLVKHKVKKQLMPIVTEQGARMICISTIYDAEESWPDHWFFQEWAEAYAESLGMDFEWEIVNTWNKYRDVINNWDQLLLTKIENDIKQRLFKVWMIVTKDDVEVFSQKHQKLEEEAEKNNPQEYFSQCWGVIMKPEKEFDVWPCIGKYRHDVYDKYYLIRDPAQKEDMSAVVLKGVKWNNIYDLQEWALNLDSEWKVIEVMYEDQIVELKNIIQKLESEWLKLIKVMDSKWQLALVSLCISFKLQFHFLCENSRRNDWYNMQKDWRKVTVGKKYLIETTKNLIKKRIVHFDRELEYVISQFGTFGKIKTQSGEVSYAGLNKAKDDFVLASCMGNFIIWDVMAVKEKYVKNIISEENTKVVEQKQKKWYTIQEVEDYHNQKNKPKYWYDKKLSNFYNKYWY